MSIEKIQLLIDEVSSYRGKTIRFNLATELKNIIWENERFKNIQLKASTKKLLLTALQKELEREVIAEIISPQQEAQQAAITRQEIKKVERLPLNAKLHLLKHNSLLNNLQLAFSDSSDYIEFDANKFISMKPEQIQDEIRRAIRNYIVINPLKAKNLYARLWFSMSLDDTEKFKKLLSDAQLHQYTTSHKVRTFKEKTTPRITYINGHPMLFGKNLVHIDYWHYATRAEKSKYDIDTSAKIFDDFYSLIRAHSYIQDSEQAWIDGLTELNSLFAQASYIIKDKQKREELELLISDIIQHLTPKKDSTIKKAKDQDLIYILENHHIIRNDNKLQAAWKKMKERIVAQQSIKNTVATQQNALHEDMTQQEIYAKELITKLQSHNQNFNLKSRSARQLAQSYQQKLYAKPFYDLHDHIIQLEDQAKVNKWMPFILKQKIEIDLLLQRRYINTLKIEHIYKMVNTLSESVMQKFLQITTPNPDMLDIYANMLTTANTITQEFIVDRDIEKFVQAAKEHRNASRTKILTEK